MTDTEYLRLMRFPPEWVEWRMVPYAFLRTQMASYVPGNEAAPEHDRHGVFQWWLRQKPDGDALIRLARLSWLDPDADMGAYVRTCLSGQENFGPAVETAMSTPYRRA
jgi:hypothetical protein